ncbi:GreA/GreB family elongation factor [Deinococcus cellulosilyticus]|uniref:Transcription elongation factor GreA n=1 Tax=Deinococcus cellulosilyticus (strain DSM 18568 / NBRC 106333 / KACC 11606 / 5516J-15) TaxID=1223518 RepID=A0A511N3C2_DEIC1|nr:GreA/GreB family elongation factor [Deinococcus cellulosilyticus]GEM47365.1 transcription elongation factor GreA [Deinococcus cellulosilyticus NBRC 106333 = KACC 11606]
MTKTHEITVKGYEKLINDLDYLKKVRRPEISDYMGKAIADGDLRESAAYDEARMLQSENEAKIAELEELVSKAVVVVEDLTELKSSSLDLSKVKYKVEASRRSGVALGARVEIEDEKGKTQTLEIVGAYEADVFKKKISDQSPLGQELLGKNVGDVVVVRPNEKMTIKYTIKAVHFD